jgi:hypothetical protein
MSFSWQRLAVEMDKVMAGGTPANPAELEGDYPGILSGRNVVEASCS